MTSAGTLPSVFPLAPQSTKFSRTPPPCQRASARCFDACMKEQAPSRRCYRLVDALNCILLLSFYQGLENRYEVLVHLLPLSSLVKIVAKPDPPRRPNRQLSTYLKTGMCLRIHNLNQHLLTVKPLAWLVVGVLVGIVVGVLVRIVQGVFFNWASPLDCPPQSCLDWPPLNYPSVGIIYTSPDT